MQARVWNSRWQLKIQKYLFSVFESPFEYLILPHNNIPLNVRNLKTRVKLQVFLSLKKSTIAAIKFDFQVEKPETAIL